MRRVKIKLNQISVLVVALFVSITLAACGDATPTTPPATTAAATTAAATTAAATSAAATSAAAATTAASATTAANATTAAASGSVWLNTPGQVPANIKGGPGVDLAN